MLSFFSNSPTKQLLLLFLLWLSAELKVELSECKRKYEVDIEEKNKIIEEKDKLIDDLMRQMKEKKKYSLFMQSQMSKTISKQINQYNFVKPNIHPLHLCALNIDF